MIYLSIALIVFSLIAGLLLNKWLNMLALEKDRAHTINTEATRVAAVNAIEELIKPFDDRINNTWKSISDIKQDLETFKLRTDMRKSLNG